MNWYFFAASGKVHTNTLLIWKLKGFNADRRYYESMELCKGASIRLIGLYTQEYLRERYLNIVEIKR